MNPFIDRFLANIPGGLVIDQDTVPALVINGVSSISLVGTVLYLSVGQKSAWFDLYGITVQQLAEQINSYTTATCVQNGIVELLALPDAQNDETVPPPISPGTWASFTATLYLPKDETYFALGMMARMLEGNKRFANSEAAQMNLQAAYGACADWWGASTGIPRYQGEPDGLYVQRIAAMRFQPTQNNVAIEKIFASLGYQASVSDTSPGKFSVQIGVPTSPQSGYTYSLAQMQDVLNQVKSGGYQAAVTVQSSLSDTVLVSDSVSAKLNSYPWTVGNVTVGEFTV